MRGMQLQFIAIAALATTIVGVRPAVRAGAGELDASAAVVATEFLVPASELDQVYLSIVDDKLAMSLAVEAHIQVTLTEFALVSIQDENLRALTEGKSRVYRQLFNTLDDLTEGRAASMMHQADRRNRDDRAETAKNDAEHPRPVKKTQGGGLSSILQNTATKAILKVRLEIAAQYADLLRAELASLPPGDFDRSYIGIEVYNQMQVLAMLRVFEQQASDDFARVLHVATAAVESQVGGARQIVGRLNNRLPLPATTEVLVNTADTSPR